MPLPAGLSPLDAMTIGTAGFTAALCVKALEERKPWENEGKPMKTGGKRWKTFENGGILWPKSCQESGFERTKPILVTGADGGVGSVAVYLLAQKGLRVAACASASIRPYMCCQCALYLRVYFLLKVHKTAMRRYIDVY